MILENVYTEQLKQIFKENHGYYLTDNQAVSSDMLKVVYEENGEVLGYAVLYEGCDFCEKEGYCVRIGEVQPPCVYIWQLATKKGHEKKGIASSVVNYIAKKFIDYDIYACVNIENRASMKVHCKNEFVPIVSFQEKQEDGTMDTNLILKRERKI